ncbi:MAG: hypothetical protein PHQ20_04110 [Candidatus Moranbacteria bacterium]|nr:hypothetical protein [Candidatus Moranbacteria bacterium]
MICKLCQKEKRLIDSHIIPRAFFEFLYPKDEEKRKSLVMISKDRYDKRRPIGSYEKLLCKDCDQMLGTYDDYAQKLLLKTSLKFYPNVKEMAYLINSYDHFKLKMFFISLLWRASISQLEEFALIDCGPFKERLRELILLNSIGLEDEFSIFLSKFDSNDEIIKGVAENNILLPAKQKLEHLNYSVFYLPKGYKVYIKVDKRDTPDMFSKLVLKNGKPLIILRKDNYEKSTEYKILLDSVK